MNARIKFWESTGMLDMTPETKKQELVNKLDSARKMLENGVYKMHPAGKRLATWVIPTIILATNKGGTFDTNSIIMALGEFMKKHPLLTKAPDTMEGWEELKDDIEKAYGKGIDAEAEMLALFVEEYIEAL